MIRLIAVCALALSLAPLAPASILPRCGPRPAYKPFIMECATSGGRIWVRLDLRSPNNRPCPPLSTLVKVATVRIYDETEIEVGGMELKAEAFEYTNDTRGRATFQVPALGLDLECKHSNR